MCTVLYYWPRGNQYMARSARARDSVNFRKFSPCIARARRAHPGWTVYPPSRTLDPSGFRWKIHSWFFCFICVDKARLALSPQTKQKSKDKRSYVHDFFRNQKYSTDSTDGYVTSAKKLCGCQASKDFFFLLVPLKLKDQSWDVPQEIRWFGTWLKIYLIFWPYWRCITNAT